MHRGTIGHRRPAGARRRAAGRCRGTTTIQVAIASTLIMGMGALSVDLGMLYVAQTELQRTADAAALAAASELAGTSYDEIEALAVQAADQYARLNSVLGTTAGVEPGDVEFGRAVLDPQTGHFDFEPANDRFDALRVTVRRAEGTEAGPVPLIFGRLMGQSARDLEATAAAVLIPRDLAVVIDLSNSMCHDSQLRYWDRADGGFANTRDVWAALDGPEPSRPYLPGAETETEYANDTGPTFGLMTQWGDPLVPGDYDPATDPGLFFVDRRRNTTDPRIVDSLRSRGYSDDEIGVLTASWYDGSRTHWENRACVLLGFCDWRSGWQGGKYESGGNGDWYISSGELTNWLPYPAWRRGGWSWKDYIRWQDNRTYDNWSFNAGVSREFISRYGLKTFTDYLLEKYPENYRNDNLWQTPEQPLRAVKDAVRTMMDVITATDTLDQVSLEIFATQPRHEVNLTANVHSVPNRLYQMQSGHYDRATNIGGGLAEAIRELESGRARPAASKVIVLMSDGVANIDENGNAVGDGAQAARDYALAKAQDAADKGFRIYTVSVGYNVDRALMKEIAAIGHGREFYAAGSPAEYTEQLEMIFRTLGGKRPVALIE